MFVFDSEIVLAAAKFVLGRGGEGQVDRTPSLFDVLGVINILRAVYFVLARYLIHLLCKCFDQSYDNDNVR